MTQKSSFNGRENANASVDSIAVVNPWGRSGSYGGPVVLGSVLFSALAKLLPAEYRLISWQSSSNGRPTWAKRHTEIPRHPLGMIKAPLGVTFGLLAGLELRRSRPDVVHLHGLYLPNLLAAFVGGGRRRRFVLLPVLERGDLSSKNIVKRALLRYVFRRTIVALALSGGIARELVSLGLAGSKVVRIGNPVRLSSFQSPRRSAPDVDGKFTVGFVGKIGPTKRPELVLEAIHNLRVAGIDAHGILIGPFADSEYEKHFRGIIREKKLEAVVDVRGYVTDVAVVLESEIDAFVLPSSAEGMPGALAEAMVAGLPVVVTEIGAMGEHTLAAECGYVVPPSAYEISISLEALATSRDLWTEMSRKSQNYGRTVFGDSAVAAVYAQELLVRSAVSRQQK